MRKILSFCLVLGLSVTAFSQQTSNSPTVNTDYLKKSKHEKTAAWILLGGGTAMIITGSIIWGNEVKKKEENVANDPFGAAVAPYTTTSGTALTVVGLASAAASIPLFVASGRNKRKAKTVSIF